ncbi:MAG: Ca2+:H+ antiporter [Chloroflexota bacterium]|nr:Ca2+:H+ antiporter [Chloroflexota bacterium]
MAERKEASHSTAPRERRSRINLPTPGKPSLRWLLVFVPISFIAEFMHLEVLLFITSALALVPLAGLLGEATESMAIHVGPRLGGLLNATFGNLTELIVAIFLVLANEFDIVKASLIGSILGNLLLVLGLSCIIGGARRSEQHFSARAAGVHSGSMFLAVGALVLPALIVLSQPTTTTDNREKISMVVAGVLITVYFLALLFTQVTHSHLFGSAEQTEETANWSKTRAMVVLLVCAGFIGFESEFLVSGLEPALSALHLPAFFVGLIIIPIIGNAAEHSSAILFAIRDKVDVTLEIAIGSSTQVALFVAPVLIFVSLALGHQMDFVFAGFEIATVGFATLIVAVISLDGRTNWLEGVQLVGAYSMIAAAAFFVG